MVDSVQYLQSILSALSDIQNKSTKTLARFVNDLKEIDERGWALKDEMEEDG